MTNKMVINLDEINKRINEGLITARKHPFLDLWIYNYTHKCQYDGLWDEYTERCRGLIIDGNGHILNNPFPKFYNLGESEKTMLKNLPAEMPTIVEKLDGMLGILYHERNEIAISTRGKFDSPYAIWATKWIREKGFSIKDFNADYTYLLEIIYPDNRIVVDYKGRYDLVLLAVRHNYNGYELDHVKEARRLGLSYAKEYSFDSIDNAVRYLDRFSGSEFEGFVCKYSGGVRVKIKSADYKRLHKLLTGVSSRDIWRSLRDTGSVDSIIENVPDEFMSWVKRVETELKSSKKEIMDKALNIVSDAKKLDNRRYQFEYISESSIKDYGLGLRKIAMLLLDNKVDRAEFIIWQMIKPSGEIFKLENDA